MSPDIYISTIPLNIMLSCEYGKSILSCKYFFNNIFCSGEITFGNIAFDIFITGILVGQLMTILLWYLAKRRK